VASIELTLRRLDTEPTIRHLILLYLKGWQTNDVITYLPPRSLEAAVQEQIRIGWHRFYEGWLSKQWMILQQRHYTTVKSTKSGRRWATALIQNMWDTAWDLWEHRNEVLHRKENLITRTMGLHLNHRVTRAFMDLCSQPLRSNDSYLVRLSLSKLLERNAGYKAQWLTVAEPALRDNRRQNWQTGTSATQMVPGLQRCMLSWLWRSGS
jgi:hypothetical protein